MSLRVVALCGECQQVCGYVPCRPGFDLVRELSSDVALRRRMESARHTREGTFPSHVCRPAGGPQLAAVCNDCGDFAGLVPYRNDNAGASHRDLLAQVAARHGYVGKETVCARCVAVRRQKPERLGVR